MRFIEFNWKRRYSKGDVGMFTESTWGKTKPKKHEVMDLIEDLMKENKISILDMLKRFSP